jgi:hypothetical protein
MNTFTITVEIAGKWEDSLLPVRVIDLKDEPEWWTELPCPFDLCEGLKEGDRAEISGRFAIDIDSNLSPYATEIKRI